MSTTTLDAIVNRVSSLLVEDFSFTRALDPESFDRQTAATIDGAFTLETETASQHGLMGFYDVRVDRVVIRLARKHLADPHATRRQLRQDASSIHAAMVRDGATGGGDYAVPDGGGHRIAIPRGAEYAELRLTVPVDYETEL
jgi:hypothetical protein